jgi:hypothetical protein
MREGGWSVQNEGDEREKEWKTQKKNSASGH